MVVGIFGLHRNNRNDPQVAKTLPIQNGNVCLRQIGYDNSDFVEDSVKIIIGTSVPSSDACTRAFHMHRAQSGKRDFGNQLTIRIQKRFGLPSPQPRAAICLETLRRRSVKAVQPRPVEPKLKV